jgi:hypothetical protein
MKLYTNYVIGCLVRLEFCNSLYPKELAVFFPPYFIDPHPFFFITFSRTGIAAEPP